MRKFEYKITLEDNFNGIDYTVINSNDPVISLCGGACTFNNFDFCVDRAKSFLEEPDDVLKARTNNPSLIEECKQVVTAPVDSPIIILHNKLKTILTADEQKAVLYHELGHIYHGDSQKMKNGTAGDPMEMEIKADQYAIDQVGPKAMRSGLEKAMKFGAEFSIIYLKEMTPAYIKVLLSNGVISRLMIGVMYKMGKKMHKRRFDTLDRLEKQL